MVPAALPDSVNLFLKLHFEGFYYLAGTLLTLSVIVTAWLWKASAIREDKIRATSLVEWLMEKDRSLVEGRARVIAKLPLEARRLLTRQQFEKLDYLKVLNERRVSLEDLAGFDPSEDADCREAAMTLSAFALRVQRSPLDPETAYRYTANDFCRWVEIWAPAIARLRQNDEMFFEDGSELYWRWRRQLNAQGEKGRV